MKLRLRREPTIHGRVTFGDLYVDGKWQCFTLEDAVRAVKVPGETAIPAGTYRLTTVTSPKFGPNTLHLQEVPGFTHVHIHAGNSEKDTEGCILVGAKREGTTISESRIALNSLKSVVFAEFYLDREVEIVVENHDAGMESKT